MTIPSEGQERALAALAPHLPADAYLAGGVAVALRVGHRHSRDLDVFTLTSDPQDIVEALGDRDDVRITARSAGTLYLEVVGIPVSILRHRYPLIDPAGPIPPLPLPVASLADLTAMKLHAIAGRGAARDFWDLHALLRHRSITLRDALAEHARRYPDEDPGHVIRSCAYFGDAEAAPMPAGLTPDAWRTIADDFERWVLEI